MTEQEEFEFRLRLESEQAAPVQPTAPSSEGYLAEAARQGFAGTVGALTGAANVMREQVLRPTGGQLTRRNPMAPFVAPPGAQEQNQAVLEAYRAGREPVYTGLMESMGSTGAEPQTGGQRIAAGAVKAMTSPESYVFPPVAAVRRLGMLGQALMRPAEQAVVGGGAEAACHEHPHQAGPRPDGPAQAACRHRHHRA